MMIYCNEKYPQLHLETTEDNICLTRYRITDLVTSEVAKLHNEYSRYFYFLCFLCRFIMKRKKIDFIGKGPLCRMSTETLKSTLNRILEEQILFVEIESPAFPVYLTLNLPIKKCWVMSNILVSGM